MPLLSANHIYSPEGLLTDHVLEVDAYGLVQALRPRQGAEVTEHHKGILCPGLINAHCHLELSHLRGQMQRGTGMTGFVQELWAKRNLLSPADQAEAAAAVMEEMWWGGTAAVGDICNSALTAGPKRAEARLYTHSFLELLGLDARRVPDILAQGEALTRDFQGLSHSLTLHAPYSVSPALRDAFYARPQGRLSIHLLESEGERRFFAHGDGPMETFLSTFNLPRLRFPQPDPIAYICEGLAPAQPVIWVHNTEMMAAEATQVATGFPQAWFCLCPLSNDFLHGREPKLPVFLPWKDRLCLGTDSLASTDSPHVWDEALRVQALAPTLKTHDLLRMLTTQGAAALGMAGELGIFAPGTRPGVLLIQGQEEVEGPLSPQARLRRLF
ncbi:MAG: hypothetical protein D6722_27900 [Bacteroidetes bacterium]|nr:MAG: hypothetical protein D6722_27900 [Bacteroidota bacterium]